MRNIPWSSGWLSGLLLSYFHPTARQPMSLMAEIHSSPLFKNLTLFQATLHTILQYHDQIFRHGQDHLVENHSSGQKGVLFIRGYCEDYFTAAALRGPDRLEVYDGYL
jgi:hypothetical protein